MRLKGAATGGAAGAASSPTSATTGQNGPPGDLPGAWPMEEMAQAGVQAVLRIFSKCSSCSAVTLSDLHKGDAVVIVSTEGTGGAGTVITLLSGVEPIFQAAPGASSSSILTPWSLGAPAADTGGP